MKRGMSIKKGIKLTPARTIVLGFLLVIFVGSLLLSLPISHADGTGIAYTDALFTSVSAVCVTGLVAFDTGTAFSVFGRTVIAILIQIGGLGITTFGLGLLLFTRKKARMRDRILARESFNFSSVKGAMGLIRVVFLASVTVELVGALLCMPVFCERYGALSGVGVSLFHSVAAFNNAGFDIFATSDSMYAYSHHTYLNIVTASLIILGGIGFFVISDVMTARKKKKISLHTRIVLSTTAVLIVFGMLLLKLTEGSGISWLEAAFTSISARTAGFASRPMADFSDAGLFLMNVLMIIGASPGSTAGGIKTTTAFVLLCHLVSYCTNSEPVAFRRRIPEETIRKALSILMLCVCTVVLCTFSLMLMEPDIPMRDIVFEVCSAFGTAGLSTGITAGLCQASKILLMLTMFIGRLGPLTIATLWITRTDTGISHAEESVQIG